MLKMNFWTVREISITKPRLKMLDARPGFTIKFLKCSLIVNFFLNTSFRLPVCSLRQVPYITLPVEDCRLAVESSCFKLKKFTIRERFRNFKPRLFKVIHQWGQPNHKSKHEISTTCVLLVLALMLQQVRTASYVIYVAVNIRTSKWTAVVMLALMRRSCPDRTKPNSYPEPCTPTFIL
jgi:hypothetical protein